MTIVEVTEAPGAQGRLHVHHREDESFWILEGDATLEAARRRSRHMRATLPLARATSRTATPSATRAGRTLFICTLGGFEDLASR
jgi:hypothetical protein